ncbi:EcsC family protein [Bacillus suaedaesalsae]|uniref:EcsC family protein n=1 Tax=Bacillus suaedaesalsae TaxID=2810349 RepID=A0ABS2DG76_9BACI|nr:EcsC family protein [Bacillus suaedaesalsae]MBM6617459.1 EcsC family protein [Bacillus suaedaesalsae]
MLTKRERHLLEEIRVWENKLYLQEKEINRSYEKWIDYTFDKLPERQQKIFYATLDSLLFHLHAIIQSTSVQKEAKERIVKSAQASYPYIQEIQDLRSLPIESLIYYAEQEIAKHRLYSFTQGGLTGSGGIFFMAADLPLIIAINLRIVQLLSVIYGYEVNSPYEMMISFKVFHISTLPKHLQGKEWRKLLEGIKVNKDTYFWHDEHEVITDKTWLGLPLKQVAKGLFILLAKRKLIQGIPLVGIGIGAGVNYSFTKQVTEFAHHFYQLRYLTEKDDMDEFD